MTTRTSRLVARAPRSYAWWVLATAMLTTVATIPGQTVGVSVFLDYILEDLGASRSTVSLLYTVGTLLASFALPFVGRRIDRHGPRVAVGVIAGLFAVACVWMAGVQSLWMLAVGFILIRGLGQGSLSLVSLHVVNLWFVKRRGLAVGMTGLGMAIATAVVPSLLERLIDALGWRAAYAILAGIVASVALPLGVTFFRSAPERYGVTPDGYRAPERDATPAREVNLTLGQARRTSAFWIVAGSGVTIAALSTGQVFHHFDIVAQAGVDRLGAAAIFLPLGLAAAGANLSSGVLLDRFPPRYLIMVMLTLQAAALLFAAWLSPAWVLAYGAVLGAAQGMNGAVSGAVYATYFGRAHIGAIKGFATTLTVAGTAVGPWAFALGRDAAGLYGPVLIGSAVIPLALAIAAWWMRPPRRAP